MVPIVVSRSLCILLCICLSSCSWDDAMYMDASVFYREVSHVVSSPADVIHNTDVMRNKFKTLGTIKSIKKWKEMTTLVERVSNITDDAAVTISVKATLGDLMLSMRGPSKKEKEKQVKHRIHSMLAELKKPVVIVALVDQNWGFMSTYVPNRTAQTINMTNHLRLHHSSYFAVRSFLDSDKIIALFVNAHVDERFGVHPKILSIPLGIRNSKIYAAMRKLPPVKEKTRLLVINNSGWRWRSQINRAVISAFNYTIRNEYNLRTPQATWQSTIRSSKFVLCPSGFSMDSFRIWETLLLGSIPVVESNPPGMDRIYSNLPVLVVRNFSVVTPAFLEKAYPCFVDNAHLYKYRHLTASYWIELTRNVSKSGSIEEVLIEHPFRNKYCDFLDY